MFMHGRLILDLVVIYKEQNLEDANQRMDGWGMGDVKMVLRTEH